MKNTRKRVIAGFAAISLVSAVCVYAATSVPYSFTSGTTAKASEVNANFSALVTAINGLSTNPTISGDEAVAGNLSVGGNASVAGQLISPRIENAAAAPAPASASNAGRMYFDTTTSALMVSNGTAWAAVAAPRVAYAQGTNVVDTTSSGTIASRNLTFTKVFPNSKLRITYSDNMGLQGTGVAETWEVLLDGASIGSGPLETTLYCDTGTRYQQETVVGYATGVTAGPHTLGIKVTPSGSPLSVSTGWQSTFLVQVEEIP